MYLKYSIRLEHVREYLKYVLRNSSTVRRSRFLTLVGSAVGLAIFGLYFALYKEKSMEFVGFWALFSVIILILVDIYYRWSYLRNGMRMYREKENNFEHRKYELEITEPAIVARSDSAVAELRWDGIDRVAELDDFTFLFLNKLDAIIIPRDAVEDGDYVALVTEIKLRCQSNR